jgi:putative FmdB family regulatory protein
MPIYEFHCHDCDREFEDLVMRSSDVVVCPRCGSENAEKLMSAFAVGGDARRSGESSCGSCAPSPSKCSRCGCG